jgi:hypothetical protein
LCESVDEREKSPPPADVPPCGQSHCRLGCVCASLNRVVPSQSRKVQYGEGGSGF